MNVSLMCDCIHGAIVSCREALASYGPNSRPTTLRLTHLRPFAAKESRAIPLWNGVQSGLACDYFRVPRFLSVAPLKCHSITSVDS